MRRKNSKDIRFLFNYEDIKIRKTIARAMVKFKDKSKYNRKKKHKGDNDE